MDKPTPAEYRADTRIDWVALGLPEQSPDVVLEGEIADAWAYVEAKTCLDLDTLDENDNLGRLALRVVKMRTLQQAYQGTSGYLGGSFNNLIKSFAVPGYSETKFDPISPDNRFKLSFINENPQIAELLWAIMTQECKDALLALMTGENPPYGTITEYDWYFPGSINLPGTYE